MIIDLPAFIRTEAPYWRELEDILDALERDGAKRFTLEEARRFHYLYDRAAAGLSKLATFASEPRIHDRVQGLTARAYAEIHETRRVAVSVQVWQWFRTVLPSAFRRRHAAFLASAGFFALGMLFGALVIAFDYESKAVLTPFPHLLVSPSERVAYEEEQDPEAVGERHATFSAQLMENNIRVSVMALAFGMTFGVGTIVALFFNGVILGVVAADYIQDGQAVFLLGWLLPHGSVEIPAILIGGQAGLLLGMTLIGWGNALPLRVRLRAIRGDLVTLMFGVALLLVWAGLVEAFISQYHEPALPYALKIAFGAIQLAALYAYLYRSGRKTPQL